MNQPGGDFVNNYVDDLTSAPPPQQPPQHAPPMPLPTTGDGPVQLAEGQPPPDYKAMGTAAATADFQTGLGTGWKYDPDAMKAQVERLRDLRDGELRKMSQHTDALTGISAPGAETVSQGFTDVANPAGASHNTQFERYKAYLDSYIETLEKIDRAYQEQDQATLAALHGRDV